MSVPSLSVRVTQAVIDASSPKNAGHCMIAQALRFMGAYSVVVTAETARFNLGTKRFLYSIPARAAAAVIAYDKDKTAVKPFTFTLDGRLAGCRPVAMRAPQPKRKYVRSKSVVRCQRRFHGLAILETR